MQDQPSKRRNAKVGPPRRLASPRTAGGRFRYRSAPAAAPARSFSWALTTTIRQRSAAERTAVGRCKRRTSSDRSTRSGSGREHRSKSTSDFPKAKTSPLCSKRPMARSLELPDYRTARPDRLTFSTWVYEPASSIADATLLATPCSAPFVGTAVGFAFARGPSEIFAIFLCLGIGMALPYWGAALFPGCVRWLPRPGLWMLVVRKFLGILLLGTAVWLIFVLLRIAGVWMAGITTVPLVCLLGYRALISAPVKGGIAVYASRRSRWITAGLAIVPLVFSLSAVVSVSQPAAGGECEGVNFGALPGPIADGHTGLGDVAATWSLTCKVRDLGGLENAAVPSRLDPAPATRKVP